MKILTIQQTMAEQGVLDMRRKHIGLKELHVWIPTYIEQLEFSRLLGRIPEQLRPKLWM